MKIYYSQNFPANKEYPYAGQVYPTKIVETFSYVNYDRVSDNAMPQVQTKLDAVLDLFKSAISNKSFTLVEFNSAYKQLNADLKLLMEEQADGKYQINE